MNILGLDISTSYIGFCVLSTTENKKFEFKIYDCIDVNELVNGKENGIELVLDKYHEIKPILTNILQIYSIERCFIESPNIVFKAGFSSIDTLSKLLIFNWNIYDFIKREGKIPVKHINARTARKAVFGVSFNSPKLKEFGTVKQLIFNNLLLNYPMLDSLKQKVNRNGNLHPYVYDICDGIVIAIAGFNLYPK